MSKHQHFHVPVQLTAISLVVFAVHLARSILPEPARSAYTRIRALACLVRAANAGQGHGLEWQKRQRFSDGDGLGLPSSLLRAFDFSRFCFSRVQQEVPSAGSERASERTAAVPGFRAPRGF